MADDVNGKLDTLIREVRANSKQLKTINTALVGDVDTGKVGLLERVRQIERWIEKREWFEKLIIAAVMANLVGLIFVLVQMAIAK